MTAQIHNPNEAIGERILRLRQVIDKTGLTKSTIYRRIKAGEFPGPVDLGGYIAGWRQSEIDAWIASLKPKSPGGI